METCRVSALVPFTGLSAAVAGEDGNLRAFLDTAYGVSGEGVRVFDVVPANQFLYSDKESEHKVSCVDLSDPTLSLSRVLEIVHQADLSGATLERLGKLHDYLSKDLETLTTDLASAEKTNKDLDSKTRSLSKVTNSLVSLSVEICTSYIRARNKSDKIRKMITRTREQVGQTAAIISAIDGGRVLKRVDECLEENGREPEDIIDANPGTLHGKEQQTSSLSTEELTQGTSAIPNHANSGTTDAHEHEMESTIDELMGSIEEICHTLLALQSQDNITTDKEKEEHQSSGILNLQQPLETVTAANETDPAITLDTLKSLDTDATSNKNDTEQSITMKLKL